MSAVMSEDNYKYDVFIAYSSEEYEIVQALARDLKSAGLNVWFDAQNQPSGPNTDSALSHAATLILTQARTLIVLFSADLREKRWGMFEEQSLRFRDPANPTRRFIPIRMTGAPLPDSMRNIEHVEWAEERKTEVVQRLIVLCKPPVAKPTARGLAVERIGPRKRTSLDPGLRVQVMQLYCRDGQMALGATDGRIELWRLPLESGAKLRFEGHKAAIVSLDLCASQNLMVSSSVDRTIRLWDTRSRECIRVLRQGAGGDAQVIFGGTSIIATAKDETILVWPNPDQTHPIEMRHPGGVRFIESDGNLLLSAGDDGTIRVWDLATRQCTRVLEGHTQLVTCLSLSSAGSMLLSGSRDQSIRLWDLHSGLCIQTYVAHTDTIKILAWHPEENVFASAGDDRWLRLWDVRSGALLRVLDGNEADIVGLAVEHGTVTASDNTKIYAWNIQNVIPAGEQQDGVARPATEQVQYTNAKVLLVGDSGAGKTGLSKRLVSGNWEPSASTVGAWATQWSLPFTDSQQVEREIWLWDFGGQADQRLIHQLYMDETALAVLVFDAQKPSIFDSLATWDRDLTRSKDRSLVKLLVAGRVDASPVPLRQHDIDSYVREHGFIDYIETSALTGQGCTQLQTAIVQSIDWTNIPWRSSPVLFKRLKEEVIKLKDEGRVLMRFGELRDALKIRLPSNEVNFEDDELKAVLRLLSGPGVILELEFGAWILFQPELINAYSQAVIATMRSDASELGCISEQKVLNGELIYGGFERIDPQDERFVLLEMHRKLLQRGLCARELTEKDVLLVFPTYYKRNRPPLSGHPAVLVSYEFDGVVDEIYSTLVVRLDHTNFFRRSGLWQDAAEFVTSNKNMLGIKISRQIGGSSAVIEVYSEPDTLIGEQIIFLRYVHDHLLQRASGVTRRRHYSCVACKHPYGDLAAATKRRELGKDDILCALCEVRIPLVDELERLYSSDATDLKVRRLEGVVSEELDNESKERVLVGEVISKVALANQLSREKNVSDHGIDMEIEFRLDDRTASGQLLFLQLKSGDSYLYQKVDGKEIFTIKEPRHADYWANQIAPVMLVHRSSNGAIRWMEIRKLLQEERKKGKRVKQIEFKGEQFDVDSILRLRKSLLSNDRH
jgi:small GTP-binding protein